MVSHALLQVQCALAGAKRLECGSLLPLCFYAQTTCLSLYPTHPPKDRAVVTALLAAREGNVEKLTNLAG